MKYSINYFGDDLKIFYIFGTQEYEPAKGH